MAAIHGGGMTETDDLMPQIEASGAKLVRAREMIARRIIGRTRWSSRC
jgi:hypothetical protein